MKTKELNKIKQKMIIALLSFLTVARMGLRSSTETYSLSSMTRVIIVSMAENTSSGWSDLKIKREHQLNDPILHSLNPFYA